MCIVASFDSSADVADGQATGTESVGMAEFRATAATDTSGESIPFQAVLRDANGNVMSDNPATIRFGLYGAAEGGTALWCREMEVPLDTNGLFSVELADGNGTEVAGAQYAKLSDGLKSARSLPLYIGLSVKNGSAWTTIAPRQKIASVPYVSYAIDADASRGAFTVAGSATLKALETGNLEVFGRTDVTGASTVNAVAESTHDVNVSSSASVSGFGTFPVGSIIMWYGDVNNLPNGWRLCDGRNGTMDLKDRFVMGTKSGSEVGKTGGEGSRTLSVANLPPHNHMYFGDDQLEGRDDTYGTTVKHREMNGYDADSVLKSSEDSRVYYTSSSGEGLSFSTLPRYRKLVYIQRVN